MEQVVGTIACMLIMQFSRLPGKSEIAFRALKYDNVMPKVHLPRDQSLRLSDGPLVSYNRPTWLSSSNTTFKENGTISETP